jgi:2-hydroxy-6-oxonona-2,4-dienedioate hydrolase
MASRGRLVARAPVSLWTDFLGAEVGWIDVDAVSTRVLQAGDGEPTIVLLHGRGGHLESWRANVGALAQRCRVVAFDLLGHGLTGRHAGGYGVEELTRHAIRTIEVLRLADAVLVGQSIGGWVAAQVARRRPDLVRSMVLVEPAGLQTEAERLSDARVAAAFERGGRAFLEPTFENVRTRLDGLVDRSDAIDDELVRARVALYQPPEARAVHRAVREADNSALVLSAEALGALGVRTLFVHGADANTPQDVVQRAARAARARLVTIDGAKQWPQLERADEVNRLIADFASADA